MATKKSSPFIGLLPKFIQRNVPFLTEVPTIFFDNNQQEINSMKRAYDIECRTIYDHQKNSLLINSNKKYQKLCVFNDNEYAKKLIEANAEITSVGIVKSDLENLKGWIELQPKGDIDIVFGWDRTLSVVEGIHSKPFVETKNIQDIVTYLMGGPEREKYIKEFFKNLDIEFQGKGKPINIIILTNNLTASSNPKKFIRDLGIDTVNLFIENGIRSKFIELIQQIIPYFKPENLICVHDKSIFGKGPALKAISNRGRTSYVLPSYDPYTGGQRKRKSRKTRRRQRTRKNKNRKLI